MKVLLFGASGNIGEAIARELVARGHTVTGATRRGATVEGLDIAVVPANVTDVEDVAALAVGQDAIVSAVGPRHGVDADDGTALFVGAAHALVDGARKAGVRRLVVVGGAGSLEIAPGVRLVDSPEFLDAWKPNALAQTAALDVYRTIDDLDWTYISPAALIEAGERTGRYRTGGEQLLTDDQGKSRITYADYAIALVDELEQRNAAGRRITVAY
ncbi:MAG TPA: NAD(P)H-binding protein [Acidimicrobiales bacterium]|jgi:hypothetical protein|nr:NAD(P)H-binding protein [Acidimicrobiales bacterium]